MAVHMGYMGSATAFNVPVYLTGSSINPVQNVNAPDLVQGQFVKHIWNWDKIETGGNITGPVVDAMGSLWQAAWRRKSPGYDELEQSGTVAIAYYKGQGRSFSNCQINSFEVSVSAGEVAQFSIDFMGASTSGSGVSCGGAAGGATCKRLVTWDQCSCTSPNNQDVQAFTVTLNNNLERIYVLGQATLAPYYIKAGFREVTGSITVYGDGCPSGGGGDTSCVGNTDIATFSIGRCQGNFGLSGFKLAWHRPEASASTGPAMYTYNFTGLCYDNV